MKFTIIKINDRSKDIIDSNIYKLKEYEYVYDIPFFDAGKNDPYEELKIKGVPLKWKKYDIDDSRKINYPLKGELGYILSYINCLEYIVKTNTKLMMILDDDAILNDNSVEYINKCLNELPENFDFLSLYYLNNHNKNDKKVDLSLDYIQRSYNQPSSTVAMIYSYMGAKKILNLIKRLGIDYTYDCYIYYKSKQKLLNGYSIKPDNLKIVELADLGSLIDLQGERSSEQ